MTSPTPEPVVLQTGPETFRVVLGGREVTAVPAFLEDLRDRLLPDGGG